MRRLFPNGITIHPVILIVAIVVLIGAMSFGVLYALGPFQSSTPISGQGTITINPGGGTGGSGTELTGSFTVTPTSLDFSGSMQSVGVYTCSRNMTVTNTSTDSIQLIGIALENVTGLTGDWAVTLSGGTFPLAPGNSTNITLTLSGTVDPGPTSVSFAAQLTATFS